MLKWYRALLPREDRFFPLFRAHAEILVHGAEALRGLLAGGPEVDVYADRIVELEDRADGITREVMQAVRKSFITPFDRGDIKDLIQSMDDAIDMMRKTVKTVRLFDQTSFEPCMREMGDVIVEAANLTVEAVKLLEAPTANVAALSALAERVLMAEERADGLHDSGLKQLFLKYGHTEPMAYIIGSEIYSELEKVMDRFEDVANEISGIVIENV